MLFISNGIVYNDNINITMRDILEDSNITKNQVINKGLLEELGWIFSKKLQNDTLVIYTRGSVNAIFAVRHTEDNEDNHLYEVYNLY